MGRIRLRVQPGASSTRFAGWYGDLPRLTVSARPVDGAANDAAIAAIADAFGVRKRQVRVVSGATSRTKCLDVEGVEDAALAARIDELNPR